MLKTGGLIGQLLALVFVSATASNETYGSVFVDEVTSIYDADTFRVNITGWPDIVGKRVPVCVKGIIESIDDHLAQHPLVVGFEAAPAWRQLWSWQDLTAGQYEEAKQRLLAELKQYELTHPGVILHAAGIALNLADYGDSFLGVTDIVTFFEDYIETLQKSDKLMPDRSVFNGRNAAYSGLGYHRSQSPQFECIHEAVRTATSKSFADHMRRKALTYVDRIKCDPEAYSSLNTRSTQGGDYADAPFLHYINPSEFACLLVQDSCPNRRLLSNLYARYEYEKHHSALADEYSLLENLRRCLEGIVGATQPPYKRLLEETIQYYFDDINSSLSERSEDSGTGGEEDESRDQ